MTTSGLWTGMILGCIGGGYFIYGKKEANAPAMICGLLMCFMPYFISNIIVTGLLGLVLMALPIGIHKYL